MQIDDYDERAGFTAYDIEHILQIPLVDVVELIAKVPRVGPGLFQGEGCRALVRKLARGRLFADLIARRAVNAEPEIRRGPESDDPGRFWLVNGSTGEEFSVRFSGDLREYLESRAQAEARAQEEAQAEARALAGTETEAAAEEEPS